MAILMQLQALEWDQQQYAQLEDAVAPGGALPEGCRLHLSAALAGGGVEVIDVWDSPEALERFSHQTVMPAAQRLGMKSPSQAPQVTEILSYQAR